MGSAASPNGIAFEGAEAVMSLALMDKVLAVDEAERTVTVQAGARVSSVIEALRPHGLTLPQLASIASQQIGGFVSVSAHGTGLTVPTVDEFVHSFTIVTPGMGTMKLSRSDASGWLFKSSLFNFALVSLGLLGVITEVTLNCIPAHKLLEHTYVVTRREAIANIEELLRTYKHVRYMWIPYTDKVVVVTNDPYDESELGPPKMNVAPAMKDRVKPFASLLLSHPDNKLSKEQASDMGMGDLRDALIALGPTDASWIKRVNESEALFWQNMVGHQYKPSDKLLQFDCGGEQHVHENCFKKRGNNDMVFMERLLEGIEERGIAAPSPIEQRWSASSTSPMSPAFGSPGDVFSWVGIIMYLPSEEKEQRRVITANFKGDYMDLYEGLSEEVGGVTHWAKIELPSQDDSDGAKLAKLQKRMRAKYPVAEFDEIRRRADPKGILGNALLDGLIKPGHP
jgi:L-galactono-1,4-lactone dehydrogenase